jgi:hypothetical protein
MLVGALSRHTVAAVYQELKAQANCSGSIDVIVHSPGGDIHSAYHIIELLRERFPVLDAVVPVYAKSAATLICLAADEILMGQISEVGPLDTQVMERKEGEKRAASALNPFKTLSMLREFVLETLDVAAKLLLSRAHLTVGECVRFSSELAASVGRPLLERLEPERFGEYARALEVAYEYCLRVLQRYSSVEAGKQDEIAQTLVWKYPDHAFVIDCRELKELGLNARVFNDEEAGVLDELTAALSALEAGLVAGFAPREQEPASEAQEREREEPGKKETANPLSKSSTGIDSDGSGSEEEPSLSDEPTVAAQPSVGLARKTAGKPHTRGES